MNTVETNFVDSQLNGSTCLKHTYNSITRYKWDLSSNTSLSCTIFGWDNLQQNQKRGGGEGRAHARERKAKKEKRISKASEEYIPRTAGLYRYSVTCIQLTLQRPAYISFKFHNNWDFLWILCIIFLINKTSVTVTSYWSNH